MKYIKLFNISFAFIICTNLWSQEKPNILFIFSDDQTFESLGAINNPEVKTPNLDHLVSEGTLFTHAFNQGGWNGAVCVASRSMLNTGSFIWKAHKSIQEMNKNKIEQVQQGTPYFKVNNEPEAFWSVLMKNAGYATYFSGKWHVSVPAPKIFESTKHIRGGMPNQQKVRYDRTFIQGEKDTWSPYDKSLEGFWKGGKHWSEVVADDAIDFLRVNSQKEKPFFIYMAFNAPHDPRQSPKKFVDQYPLEDIGIPKSFIGEYPYNEASGSGRKLRDERLAPFPRTKHAVKVNRQEYYAIISHMDAQIGRVIAELKRTKQLENTYIIFTSDHGLAVGDHGFIGKQNMYERSVRVPLIISGPEIPKAKKVEEMVYMQDIMPTTLELANIPKPEHVDFNSLLPLAQGLTTKGNYDAIYGAYMVNQRSVRTKDHKLIIYPTIKKVRLYDLKNDSDELIDLAENNQNKKLVKRLFSNLFELQKQTKDSLNLVPTYKEYFK